ncbi:type IV pilin protein [Bilifractor sp. LCP21S3_A7]|uniref:type IV pilin protein n=1 Tax=Bilifractor sp. LCP21S3_A7 TaxID=3438738 RepID=UPI003F93B9E5
MFKKLKNSKKGFTLAELLIVVAIIGVLVAISIPIFSAQLEKAREATDQANIRNAYAEVTAACLADNQTESDETNKTDQISAITYKDGTYSCTVTATQSDKTKWESGTTVTIGGQPVNAAASWTISGKKDGKVSIS